MKTKLAFVAALFTAAPLGGGLHAASAIESAWEATISIRDFSFAPVSLTIAPGTTVRWRNLDGEPHTIRGVDSNLRSEPLDQHDSFAFRFDKPGTYRYVCSIHPRMTGTIIVRSP